MKHTTGRLLCLLLSVVMLFSLAACGKNKDKNTDPNLIKLGDYTLLYKDACIMEDSDGNDALIITLDFTNNSKDNASYLWSVSETAMQNGVELEVATVFTGPDSYDTVIESQFLEVAPGTTLEVCTSFVLNDGASEVEVTFEEAFGSKSGKITIDPSELNHGSAGNSASGSAISLPTAGTGDLMLDWWNGDWYGWWSMTGCSGYYADAGMEGQSWDICGAIDIGEDYMGTVTLWDADYAKAQPMVSAAVSLNEDGTTEYGTIMSEGGYFTDMALEHADWIVDPGLVDFVDTIIISGDYENGADAFTYDILLRRWGTYWEIDMDEAYFPAYYYDWCVPLIDEGKPMPDSIGADAPAGSGNNSTPASDRAGNTSGGDGIVTEEQVQKGYVWMNEVAKDIFNTSYEEIVDYFGVEGEFVKEEYSDHMKVNKRYYKWISSENPNNFIYVNFDEDKPGVYTVSGYNTSGFSGSEAIAKYLDAVKAEAAEVDKAAAANMPMKDFSLEVTQFAKDDVKVTITTTIPESGWSSKKDMIVENEDPDAFGAGAIKFTLRESLEKLESNKSSYKNFQEIEDRVIGGITFKGRTYEYIGYDWIEYVAQIDDTRALSIGLTDLDCVPGTVPDIILNNMKFQ